MSEELFARSKKVAPGGVHSPVRALSGVDVNPIFFRSGEGAVLTDEQGKEYIDFCQSFGPLILGHRDKEVSEAVLEIYNRLWTLGACEKYSLELAEFVCSEIPWVEKLRFVTSGTEAVMTALRLARAATGREKVLKFEGCYHGHADSMLVKAGSGLAGESAASSAGVSSAVASETLVAELDMESQVEAVFSKEGKNIAAVIIEPLPANFGLLPQRQEFLQSLCETARKHGSLVILDEVISGFRVSMQGMAGELGIRPDLVTYGKVLGGGFPVGCYAGRADLMEQIAPQGPVYQAGTLAAQPLAMAAGLATLKKLKRDNIHSDLSNRAAEFAGTLNSLFAEFDPTIQVVQQFSLFWMNWQKGEVLRRSGAIAKKQAEKFSPLFHALVEQGIYLAPNAYEVNFVSLAHDHNILDTTIDRFKKALAVTYG